MPRRLQKLGITSAITSIGLFFAALVARAATDPLKELDTVGSTTGLQGGKAGGIYLLIQQIINVFIGILGAYFTCMVIYAGFLWITSQGEPAKVTKAKKFMINALIGLLIIFTAYAITTGVSDFIIGGLQ